MFGGFLALLEPGGELNLIMIVVGLVLIGLAIFKEYEPLLLLPMGFGCILCNLPLSHAVQAGGFLSVLYNFGIENELFPILLFIGIGAMCDFGPFFRQPVTLVFGITAQAGIFAAMGLALLCNYIFPGLFTLREAAAVGIIGAADGPSAIFIGRLFAPKYFASIMVAAYSYMSLVPLIQPPVVRALTTKKERRIHMTPPPDDKQAGRAIRILFPIVVTIVTGLIAPMATSLIGALMFGNLLKECGVTEKLSQTAQNELSGLTTLLLGITIGSTMIAENFLKPVTLLILLLGLLAFVFDTAGGVLTAKLINVFLPEGRKINPMIGACGISAFPMSARVIQKMAQKEDPSNFILMPAVGANAAGQIGSILVASVILSWLG